MKKEKIELGELTLVGLTARTNNKNEMNPATSRIAALAGFYWNKQLANTIKHRVNPGVTYSVYTEYESDENGEYTYLIGEVVDSTQNQNPAQFKTLTLPASSYQKFTTEPGGMPDIVITAWQSLWKMNRNDFGGERKYLADFEVYDHRASDPNHAVIDIFIGIR